MKFENDSDSTGMSLFQILPSFHPSNAFLDESPSHEDEIALPVYRIGDAKHKDRTKLNESPEATRDHRSAFQ